MTIDPLYILANVGAGLTLLFVVFRVIRDDRRCLAAANDRIAAAERATADTVARVAKSPHSAFGETLARAPDAFAEARARAAVLASQIPPEIASGEAPDPRAPRFIWWTTREQAEAVEVAILPLWLAAVFARRMALEWAGDSMWSAPEFDLPNPMMGGNVGHDGIVITANEFGCVFANPGRVTDLAGNPVAPPADF